MTADEPFKVGEIVRKKSQREIHGTVIGLKMNAVVVKYPSGNQTMWDLGECERIPLEEIAPMPEYVAQVHDFKHRDTPRWYWYIWPKGKEKTGVFTDLEARRTSIHHGHGSAQFRWLAISQMKKAYAKQQKLDAIAREPGASVVYDLTEPAKPEASESTFTKRDRKRITRELHDIERDVNNT